MRKLKFYILCSHNIHALRRHFRVIPKAEAVVVINTLDDAFKERAAAFCSAEGIQHYVTESNGTAAKGKNSVLDIFEASSNTHAVMIDGDDFITEHGYNVYTTLCLGPKMPDVLAHINQKGIRASIASFLFPVEECEGGIDPDSIEGVEVYPFKRDSEWWANIFTLPDDSDMKIWAKQCRRYISEYETHLRFTLVSKAAAKLFRFDERFKVGEDTLMYLRYKKAWADGLLDLVHYDEDIAPTYVYDERVGGVVAQESMAWVVPLAQEYKNYEERGWMVEATVPVINRMTEGVKYA